MNASNGGRGSQEHKFSFRRKIITGYSFSFWLVAGRNERGGVLSDEVHVARAVSAFQAKLSTASRLSVKMNCICDGLLCYPLYIIYQVYRKV